MLRLNADGGVSAPAYLQQSDTINVIKLAGTTGQADTVPTGANYVVVTSSVAATYVQMNITPGVPGANVTDGTGPEIIPTGGGLYRYVGVPLATTGSLDTGISTTTLNLAAGHGLKIGNTISIAGAGAAGVLLTTKIDNLVTNTATIHDAASTTVVNAVVTRINTIGVNNAVAAIVTFSYYK